MDSIQDIKERATISPKSRSIFLLLAFFLMPLGVHRLYVGRPVGFIIMTLVTLFFYWAPMMIGFMALIGLVDFLVCLCGGFKDGDGLKLKNW